MKSVRNTTSSVRNEDLLPGDLVEVSLAGGHDAERVVWRVDGNIVFVCSQTTYERLQCGDMAAQPIGFPIGDVRVLA